MDLTRAPPKRATSCGLVGYNYTMFRNNRYVAQYRYWLADWRRLQRILFPSPAEVKLIRILGGRVLVIPWLRGGSNRFPLAMVVSMGKIFRSEGVHREMRVGSKFIDFGVVTKYYRKAVECDGTRYHDILKDQERDEYLKARGFSVLHIKATRIYREPKKVRRMVIDFLES